MRVRKNPIAVGPALVGIVLLAVVGTSCSDPETPSVNNGTNNENVNCANETLSIAISDPSVEAGFAPLTVSFDGQVSLIEPVFYTWKMDFGDGGQKEGVNSLPQATTIYNDAGEFDVSLTVTDTTCNKVYGPVATKVTVYPEVELEGEELIGRPGNVSIGEALRVSMRLLNTSENALTVPVGVRFYLSTNAGVAWEQLPTLAELGDIVVEPEDGITIGGGSRRSLDATFTVPNSVATGAYSIIAAIDHAEHVGEDDNTRNNIVASDATVFVENNLVDAPDLTVSNVQVGPTTAFQRLSSISINADLLNIGSGFATDVDYAVYLQPGTDLFDPATAVKVYQTTDPLPLISFEQPDNSYQVRGQQLFLPEPIQLAEGAPDLRIYAFVVVDPDNTIREGGPDDTEGLAEANNIALSQGSILLSNEPQPGIDIVVIGFDFQPRATFLNGSVQITLEVANFGTEPTRSFFCSVYLSEDATLDPARDHRLTNLNFNNLLPTDVPTRVQQTAIVPGFFEVGEFHAFALCDASNSVGETFEDNNLARLDSTITITPDAIIDLEATSIAVDSAEVADGDALNLSVTVCNTGSNGAGPSTMRVRLSQDSSITATDRLIAEVPFDPIAPDTCRDVEIPLENLTCDIFRSEYTIGVVVDATNVVVEVNEPNNTHTLDHTIMITGDRCECQDDDYEPNDSAQNCAPLTAGQFDNLSICSGGNKDFYCVQLDQGDSLAVDVNLTHAGTATNLDLRLLDPNFQQIATAISRTDGQLEQAGLFLVPQQGRYIIEVGGRTANDVNEYGMNVRVSQPGPGTDLTGTDMTLSDTSPALAQTLSATFTTLNTRNDASGAYDVTLWLSTDTAIDITDFPLTMFSVDNVDGARSRMDTQSFVIPVEATEGNYYVCAQLDSGNAVTEQDETNNVLCSAQLVIDTSCYDPFEDNNTPQTATPIVPGTYENLNVCNMGRVDYYSFTIRDGQRFSATVDFVHAMGDIDLRLHLDDGNTYPEVRSSTGTSDQERIEFDYVNGEQRYILQVFHNDPLNRDPDGTNSYTLNLVVEEADPTLRCDALFEPNDSPDQAIAASSNLLTAVNQGLVLDRCPQTDVDFFYVDLVAGPQVSICVGNDSSNPQPFNFAIALFDPSQAQLQANTGPTPCIRQQINVTGRYFLRVLSTNRDWRAIRYNISIDGLFGTDLVGRNLVVDPTDIEPGASFLAVDFTLQNARTQRADTVEYGLYYSSAGPIINPTRDLELLRGSIPGGLDGFSERQISEVIIVPDDPAFHAGLGHIGIYIDPDNRVSEIDEGNNRLFSAVNILVCEDDAFEGNGTLNTAAPVTLNTTYNDLVICPGSEDFFCYGQLQPGDYRADVAFAAAGDRTRDLNVIVWNVDGAPSQIGAAVGFGDDANAAFTLAQAASVCVEVVPFDRSEGSNSYSLRTYGPLAQLGGVDLSVTSASAAPDVLRPGSGEASVSFRVVNLNADDATNVAYQIYFSSDATIDPANDTLVTTGTIDSLPGFAQLAVDELIPVPDDAAFPDGTGYFGVVVDGFNAIVETREDNNIDATTIFLSRCTDGGVTGNGTLAQAAALTLGTARTGQNICPTDADWYCFDAPASGNYRVGLDFALDGAMPDQTDLDLTVYRTNALGELIDELASDRVVASGATLDFALPDAVRVCMEITASAPFGANTYTVLAEGPIVDVPQFELRALGVSVTPTSLTAGVDTVDYAFSIDNQGSDAATDVTWVLVYSPDDVIDPASDLILAQGSAASAAQGAPAAVSGSAAFPDVPAIVPGAGFIAVVVDSAAAFTEPNENDNTVVRPITVLAPAADLDLEPSALVITPTTIEPGTTTIDLQFDATNHGADDATNVSWTLWYSTDDVIDPATDVLVANGNIAALAGGATVAVTDAVAIPLDPAILDGAAFMGVVLDASAVIPETNEANNAVSTAVTITINVVIDIDVEAVAVGVAPTTIEPGVTALDYTIDVRNNGADDATDIAWTLVYSADSTLDAATDLELASGTLATLGAGLSDTLTGNVAVPTAPSFLDGPGFIGVIFDAADAIAETDEGNNDTATPVTVTISNPLDIDATVFGLSITPTTFTPGLASIDYAFTVEAAGADDLGDVAWALYYSMDADLDPATDKLLASGTVLGMSTGEQVAVSSTLALPNDGEFVAGDGFVFAVVDPAQLIAESDEANNLDSTMASVVVGVDLSPSDLSVTPTDIAPDASVDLAFTLWNLGNAEAASVTWRLYYSTDATIDPASDTFLLEGTEADLVGFEQRLVASPLAVTNLAAFANGAGFFGVVVDPADAVSELDELNNATAADINLILCTGADCCAVDNDCTTACTATATCSAQGVCERTYRDGDACTLTCTDATVNGTCDVDRCVVAAEGPTGTAACGDMLDNDCDGAADAADTDCAVPDLVMASAPATATVGLASPGADVTVHASNLANDATGQDRNLYCTGRRLFQALDPADGDWLTAATNAGYPVVASGGADVAGNVRVGVPFDDTNPDSPLGVKICNGYAVEVGPIPISFADVNGTLMIATELGNPAQSALGDGQVLLESIRGSFSTAYHPQFAVGDGDAAALTTSRIVHFGSQTSLIVRYESMAAANDFTDNCGFVRGLKLFRTTRVSTAITSQYTRTNWFYNGADNLSSEGFNGRAVGTTFFDQFFTADPATGHQGQLANGIGVSNSRAAEWRSHAIGDTTTAEASTLDLPSQGTLPDLLTLRQRPLLFDFWGRLNDASSFATNDGAHLWSTSDGVRYDRLASFLPRAGLPAIYDGRNDRFAVELPEDAKTLAAARLRLSNNGLADENARLDLDTLFFYFNDLHVDLVTTATQASFGGDATVTVNVKAAEAGPHEVQCYWQVPGDPAFDTVASDPVRVDFQ